MIYQRGTVVLAERVVQLRSLPVNDGRDYIVFRDIGGMGVTGPKGRET
jgi:hypothetical protein